MAIIGTVESLWRYPVKGMRGEELNEAFMGFSGIYGDRCYAFKSSAARKGFPYLSASAQPEMLRFRPQFRYPERAQMPSNLLEAMSIAPGIMYANAEPDDLALNVVTPAGETLAIDDPVLKEMLADGIGEKHQLTLVRSDRSMTDCRPVSLIGVETARQIGAEMNFPVDKRRFRANIYLNHSAGKGFAENELINRRVRIGERAEMMILERDPRCKVISLDPETGEHNPAVLKQVAQAHSADAGVYCAVLVEGILAKGDAVELLD